MKSSTDNDWYKDAIIYQLHVRAYCDSSGDGIGDFAGLTSKLDYLRELGVNALWLLPFYPSPLRDDGYDIADYRGIHADYGTLADFRRFLREAHNRDLRVITELVINHTSDQHPWFRAARAAPAGSPKRDFYVWSRTAKRYETARIIFTDYENSNWAWDDTAQAYYWHRFFSHQPDLNFDNPQVIKAVLRAMRFWLDMGVDGLRLDAIPYLIEREGTSCENLPETHAIIRQLRAELDRRYSDRVFLAEANQWPEDVREYFGEGDECHMAYHFPLMPRIFMAIAQEDRHPISEILLQTPDIPDNCQWAIFLRNHDELTLEMVTDRERDYMYDIYATDPRARVNLGIRRRLASLMDNDRAKIELLNSLLLSMPGSPIIYYGDEIGMGDNIYLGDRHGVRTPMQWSPDRNAGFSRADPQRLYLPLIMDPLYGYEAVNVEAQARHASSLLNWMRRLIATRKNFKAFGRGRITLLRPGNRKILAYLHEYGEERILCVFNLSHSAQPVELDLSAYKGLVPVELLDNSAFPAIGELPYLLSLPRYGFYWFGLSAEVDPPVWHVDKLPREELPVLVLPESLLAALVGGSGRGARDGLARKTFNQLKSEVLPAFFDAQHWFSEAAGKVAGIELEVASEWRGSDDREWLPLLVRVTFDTQPMQICFLPLGMLFDGSGSEQEFNALSPWMLARVRQHARMGIIYDALGEDAFCLHLLDAMAHDRRLPFGSGEMVFSRRAEFPDITAPPAVQRPGLEQSNNAIIFADQAILKVYRRVQEGVNPELEMGRFLSDLSPRPSIAPLIGSIEYHAPDSVTAIAVMHRYMSNQGTLWDYTQDYLDRLLTLCIEVPESVDDPETHAVYATQMGKLGQRTAELHCALATGGNPQFDPQPLAPEEIDGQRGRLRGLLLGGLEWLDNAPDPLPEPLREMTGALLAGAADALDRLSVPGGAPLYKLRVHGNYHLGQILIAHNDFVITDFEGDPDLPLQERRARYSPLKDVAGMHYSLTLAAAIALQRQLAVPAHEMLEHAARVWERTARDAFMSGYLEGIAACTIYPADAAQARALLDFHLTARAVETLHRTLHTRPTWLEAVIRILYRRLVGNGPDPRGAADD
ncbi:maltose alpha-D-glucosyltransferase [Sedimenticola hydrogenitrophicus]|uniref:maltose alpha-D-glucosyltransferase n=1 Tax=Sedimenticola hydrogenitrophicus TaxID=2967975 RepID=UPI0021A2E071|nr:maltose alpha-D-glucosyltransferase [Sedimenticola hydrogenitrophicus]